MDEHGYTYKDIEKIADHLRTVTGHQPLIGIVCGSGLGELADTLQNRTSVRYEDIPNFPVSTVQGHAGELVFGKLEGIATICMKGRIHPYEGYPLWLCAMPMRVMKLLGVQVVIITNAAGCMNPAFSEGDIMIIKDHINFPGFVGDSPLKGNNDERWGPRFLALSNCYDGELRQLAWESVDELEMRPVVREGVYTMVSGPHYETIAEVKLLQMLGTDAIGMSTVHEVIVAHHAGLKVLGLSLLTNKCVGEYEDERVTNHADVLETANKRKKDLQTLVKHVIGKIGNKVLQIN